MFRVASRCDVFEHSTSGRYQITNTGVMRRQFARGGVWRLVEPHAVMPLYAVKGIAERGYHVDEKVTAKSRGWYEQKAGT
jgi:hypothetical protein